jgi:transcriptional regulator with XRE-family HTH domain
MDRFMQVDGARLRGLRRRAALSQRDLARIAGTRQETISRLEGGERAARGATIRKLAEALGVEPHELMKGGHDA